MGGMRKAWVIHDGGEWLLKFPRPGTGEHWAEKIAAEVGELIGVNTAAVELARVGSALATICRSFRPDEAISTDLDQPLPVLFHGSEFLAMAIPDYDLDRIRNNTAHNIKNIVRAVLKIMNDVSLDPVQDSERMMEVLASYAVLDGLIGNSDRHHDNWMVRLDYEDGGFRLCILPSFDHASSLGRELRDESRMRILASNGVLNYLTRGRARGGVYVERTRRRAPPPLHLAEMIFRWRPELRRAWSDRLSSTSIAALRSIIDSVPDEFMSGPAREFAYQVLVASRCGLLRSIG